MAFWTDEYREITDNKVKVNYQGTGSSDGIKKMTSREFVFGCSDAPMNQKETADAKAAGGEVIHLPLVVGAVVPAYRLDGVEQPLVFTGPVLADIFLGKVKRWNEPAIVALNPTAKLPDLEIQAVFRSEGSGTSYVFSEYLSKVSPEFAGKVGATKAFPDKVGVGKKGSEGVAGHIATTNGAIGYIELTYALDTKATFGSVRNKSGKDVRATLASVTAAAEVGANRPQTAAPYDLHDLTYNLTDLPGDDVYPITATSFALLYKKQPKARGKAVVEFLKWAASSEGQRMAESRNYAQLPAGLRAKVAAKLEAIEFE
jgi:phosphate transport system substrate-binding protein